MGEWVRYIDEIVKIYPKTMKTQEKTLIVEFVNPKKSPKKKKLLELFNKESPVIKEIYFCEEYEELEEVIGSFMNFYKVKRIYQINRIKKLFKYKSVAYDKNEKEHIEMLISLWKTVKNFIFIVYFYF